MIARCLRVVRDRIRVVLPPGWTIAVVVLAYGLIELVSWIEWWRFTFPPSRPRDVTADYWKGFAFVLNAAAFAYGGFRVVAFHPFFRATYREWLQTSPWKHPQRLPLGPVHLVWQDLVIVGCLGLVMMRGAPSSVEWYVPLVSPSLYFLINYLVILGVTFLVPGGAWFGYAIGFGLGLVIRLGTRPVIVLLVLVPLYLAAWIGLRRMLSRFDSWDLSWFENAGLTFKSLGEQTEVARGKLLGWPFDRISLKPAPARIGRREGIALSLLGGWLLWAIGGLLSDIQAIRVAPSVRPLSSIELGELQHFLAVTCGFPAAGRLFLYCWGYLPPLNLVGRLIRFRWIIPGYDRVLVSLLVGIAIAYYLPVWLNELRLSAAQTVGVTMTAFLLVVLNGGPSLLRWRLTGNHRIVPGILGHQLSQELERV